MNKKKKIFLMESQDGNNTGSLPLANVYLALITNDFMKDANCLYEMDLASHLDIKMIAIVLESALEEAMFVLDKYEWQSVMVLKSQEELENVLGFIENIAKTVTYDE